MSVFTESEREKLETARGGTPSKAHTQRLRDRLKRYGFGADRIRAAMSDEDTVAELNDIFKSARVGQAIAKAEQLLKRKIQRQRKL